MFETGRSQPDSPFSAPGFSWSRRNRWRLFKDGAARHAMAVGGIGVIIAILLIFFYLVYEVIPLFQAPRLTRIATYAAPGQGESLVYFLDERAEIAARCTDRGEVYFFDTKTGAEIRRDSLAPSNDIRITAWAQGDRQQGLLAFGFDDGRVKLVRQRFIVSYPSNIRQISPKLETLFDDEELRLFEPGIPVQKFAVQSSDERTTLVAWSKDHAISVLRLEEESSLLGDEIRIKRTSHQIQSLLDPVEYLMLDKAQRVVYVADRQGILLRYTIAADGNPRFDQQLQLVRAGESLTALTFLSGDLSLLAGSSSGMVSQWFIVREPENRGVLTKIRAFHAQASPITALIPEQSRKGFVAADASGKTGIYNSTAERTLLLSEVSVGGLKTLSLGPRNNA
ncbi:MAG: hypothetical protein ACRERS_06695, partial [Methylococcales bacterium]